MNAPRQGCTFTDVLGLFPNLAALAAAMGLRHSTVAAWKRRDSIPENRWRAIAAAAKTLRVQGVTYTTLSAASRAKALQGDQAPTNNPRTEDHA